MIEFPGTPNAARADEPDAVEPRPSTGYLALPDGGAEGPGVLVLHAWWGLNDTFRGVCDRIAGEGFVALAPDLYGGGRVVTTIEDAETAIGSIDQVGAEQAALGGLDRLLGEPARTGDQVGVVGFSLGASYAGWLGRKRPEVVGATVLFYGTGDHDGASGPVLGHFALGDEYEPDEDVDAMERAIRGSGRPVELVRYPGVRHWFFEPDRPEFDAEAAQAAWVRTVESLREHLAG